MISKTKELQGKFPAFDEAILEITQTANFYVASQTNEYAVRLCMAYAFEAGYRQAAGDLRTGELPSDAKVLGFNWQWADWLLEKAGMD
jgi:hypothetical protein